MGSNNSFFCARCEMPRKILNGATYLYIVRHGRTNMNEERLIIGNIDDPLADVSEVARFANQLKETGETFDAIVASPLQRAKRTGEIIASLLKIPMIISRGLRERCVGKLEGKPEYPEMLRNFLRSDFLVEGMEPLKDFETRVIETMVALSHSYQGKRVLVVTHALPLLAIMRHAHGWDMEQTLLYGIPKNCELTEVIVSNTCTRCKNQFFERATPR